MTNDRRSIEAALPSSLLAVLLCQMRSDADNDDDDLDDIISGLQGDVDAALEGGDMSQRRRRLGRAVDAARQVLNGRTRAAVILAIVYLVGRLIADERLFLLEGSPFERAYCFIIKSVNKDPKNAHLLDAVDKSASRAATRMRDILANEGYYQ